MAKNCLCVGILVNRGAVVDHHDTVVDYSQVGVIVSLAICTVLGCGGLDSIRGRACLLGDSPIRGNAALCILSVWLVFLLISGSFTPPKGQYHQQLCKAP